MIVLETERLYLREFTTDDAKNFFDLNADEEVMKYTGDVAFKSIKAATQFLLEYNPYEIYKMGRWVVCLKSTNEFIGWCGLKFHPESKIIDVGYRFFQKHWNKGYATESCSAVLDYGFNALKLDAIYAHAHIANTKSQNVLEKCGLVKIDQAIYDGMPAYLFKINNPYFSIKTIDAKDTYSVRHPVLRPGRPIEDCAFEGDDLQTTFHLGLYFKDELAGVVTFLETNNRDLKVPKQFQLRGMAVLKSYRGLNFGKQLVTQGELLVKAKEGSLIWLNAREIAVPFYKKMGYTVFGVPFDIPIIGPHYSMCKQF
ncbi:GNAT family N-acetyltransferase [Formosa sp. S-31]|uniref:GNAT family N-acetyltransferase n=1 Tax=Formosa sp. S-31 TaxID=2790949 RepID=UPI003EBD30A9